MKIESMTLTQIVVATLISQVAAHCRGRPDGFFVADPFDRRRFFWCDGGEAFPSQCPDGLFFFEDQQLCKENRDPCLNKPDEFFVADPSDRRRFFWCYDGEGHASECPKGTIFSQEHQMCNDDVTTARPGPSTRPPLPTNRPNVGPCKNVEDGKFVADPTDRRRFYWCSGGEAYPSKCPDGTYFFQDGQYCDVDTATTPRPVPPVPSPRPPPNTTARPVPTARPPPGTTARPTQGPPTRGTTGAVVRTTTRGAGPPVPIRTTTTTRGPPVPTRPR